MTYLVSESSRVQHWTPSDATPLGKNLPERVARIIIATAGEHHIDPIKIVGKRRTARLAWCRQVVMWRLREMSWGVSVPSLPQIGRWLNRDHTTILHGLRKYEENRDAVWSMVWSPR